MGKMGVQSLFRVKKLKHTRPVISQAVLWKCATLSREYTACNWNSSTYIGTTRYSAICVWILGHTKHWWLNFCHQQHGEVLLASRDFEEGIIEINSNMARWSRSNKKFPSLPQTPSQSWREGVSRAAAGARVANGPSTDRHQAGCQVCCLWELVRMRGQRQWWPQPF